MKKTALLAAAAALAAASPAAAGGGYLGLNYNTGESSILLGQADSTGWQGEGAVGFGGSGWGAQLNAAIGSQDIDDFGLDFDTQSAAGHLWWTGSGWRLGGVIAYGKADAGSGIDIDDTVYGIEGTFDFGPNTVAFGSITTGNGDFAGADYDTTNFDVGLNFYSSPNIRFGGFIGTGNIDFGGGGDTDSMSYGLNAEFQPWSAPVSVVVGWNNYQIDDVNVDVDMFRIGARWNFGGTTLRDRDNSTPFTTTTGVVNRTIGSW